MKLSLLLLSILAFFIFTLFSYTVAKELWQKVDFDTMVKIQDKVPRKYDDALSYFSLLGSAEITVLIIGIFAIYSVLRLRFLSLIGWLLVIPATLVEIMGKLILFHPGPPVLFHRSVIETQLPSFYIQTNFSYPSGHMTRTVFILTVFFSWFLFKLKGFTKALALFSILLFAGMMSLTRISLGEHWLSDVLGGALLGISTGLLASFLIHRAILHKR